MRFSRSSQQAYQECPRLYYLKYVYGGTGIEPDAPRDELAIGSLTHSMLASILNGGLVVPGTSDASKPGAALAEGMARGWAKVRWPFYQEHFDVLFSEQEINCQLKGDVELMSRIDGVLRRKSDGEIFPLEFKTTGTNRDNYLDSWQYSSQILTHLLVGERLTGRPPAGVIMEFLYKGYKKQEPEGTVYYSPYMRAYRNLLDGSFGYDSSLGRKKGWETFCPYEEIPMEDWVRQMPDEVLRAQFFTRLIQRNNRDLEIWKAQTVYEQRRIQEALVNTGFCDLESEALTEFFPARLDECCFANKYHAKCEMLKVCYGEIDDPVGNGYKAREPHHPQEFLQEES